MTPPRSDRGRTRSGRGHPEHRRIGRHGRLYAVVTLLLILAAALWIATHGD